MKIPFFAKMTPNITDIVEIATAAKEGEVCTIAQVTLVPIKLLYVPCSIIHECTFNQVSYFCQNDI